LAERDEGDGRAFDDLARGLDTGAISRGRAIRLSGAALVDSALGLFASRSADAQEETVVIAVRRRRCLRRGGNFCKVNRWMQRMLQQYGSASEAVLR
jgi:hypothetical protein